MWFGQIMSKTYQYATNAENVIASLKHVNVKVAQNNLQKIITWTKIGRGKARMGEGRC
jgi:hypothetical protein